MINQFLPKKRKGEVTVMNQGVTVPHGEEKITVELTVKEAIALTGIRFNEQPDLLTEARKKLRKTLESKVMDKTLH